MRRLVLPALLAAASATSALAQAPDPHAGHATSPAASRQAADPHAGHVMPASPEADPHAGHAASPAPSGQTADPHAGHVMPASPKADPHADHAMTGAELSVGAEPPPPVPTDKAADRFYSAAEMDGARGVLRREHGGERSAMTMLETFEYRPGEGRDGYAWEGELWYGGDVNRLVLKSEGEGAGDDLEEAEVQALYSRAIGPYFDLQAGVRQDFEPRPRRTYATLGVEGLAPYWFEVEGAVFLSDRGDLIARLEGSYDLRLTQRVMLEPRAELNLSAQDVSELAIGSGLTDAELGLRLRYEIRREFAPYIGVNYERKFGDTADLARAAGEDVEDTRFVVGLRAWW